MPSVHKKLWTYFPDQADVISNSELLKTIVFPKNLMYLTDQLPRPSYEDDEQVDADFEEHVKWATLPHKPYKKRSSKLSNVHILSRSKASTREKVSGAADEHDYLESIIRSSHSKGSRPVIPPVSYKDYLNKHQLKKQTILNSVSSLNCIALTLRVIARSNQRGHEHEHQR
jgi:hypothetical protein